MTTCAICGHAITNRESPRVGWTHIRRVFNDSHIATPARATIAESSLPPDYPLDTVLEPITDISQDLSIPDSPSIDSTPDTSGTDFGGGGDFSGGGGGSDW